MFTLLLVDDEVTTRLGLIRHLPWGEMGIGEIIQAENGKEGLAMALKHQPDIIITDIRMPKMNGIEFSGIIAKELPSSKLIYISGYSDKDYMMNAIDLRVVGYVEKPIDPGQIRRVVDKAVALCREDRQRAETSNQADRILSTNTLMIKQKLAREMVHLLRDENALLADLRAAKVAFNTATAVNAMLITLHEIDEEKLAEVEADPTSLLEDIFRCFPSDEAVASFLDDSRIIIFFTSEEPIRIAHTAFKMLKESYGRTLEFSGALGGTVYGVSNTYKSYREACELSQKLFFHGYGNLFTNGSHTASALTISPDIEREFALCLGQPDENISISYIESLGHRLASHGGISIQDVQKLYFRLSALIDREAANRRLTNFSHTDPLDVIFQNKTLHNLCSYLRLRIKELFALIKEMDASSLTVIEVMKYIRSHCSDEQLTVREIASHVHLSPSYLSMLFKKEAGKTVSEHIVESRVELAKSYLTNGCIKIYEVAQKVGYNDPNYFAKAFKRITGFSPSEYKERQDL